MAFGFDEKLKDGGNVSMMAGINRNPSITPELAEVDTFVTGLEYVPADEKSSGSLKITMKDSENRTLEHRIFDPTVGEYAGKKQETKVIKVVANLSRKFLGANYVFEEVPTFEGFCNKLINDIGIKYKGVALRTKVVYNNKGFTKLPSYAPIWELASVPVEDSELAIDPRFDIIDNPVSTSSRNPVSMDNVFGAEETQPEINPFGNSDGTI